MHDGWVGYHAHQDCRHALCTIQHLRELTCVQEQYQQTWAADRKHLLVEMKEGTEQARRPGQSHLAAGTRDALVRGYHALVAAGLAANPPPERRPHQRGRLKQSPVRNLLERLWWERDQVLAFLYTAYSLRSALGLPPKILTKCGARCGERVTTIDITGG